MKTSDRKISWAQYNQLNRYFARTGDQISLVPIDSDQIRLLVHLDLIPYLNSHFDNLTMSGLAVNTDELSSCLTELNSALYQANLKRLESYQLACLRTIISKLRISLRLMISSELDKTFSLNPQHQASMDSNSKQHPNSITSRNLVGDEWENFVEQQKAQQQQISSHTRILTDSTTAGSQQNRPISDQNTEFTGNTSYISRAYRDALSSALGIVVGSGLLILLLNLVVVLLIAIRARRARRNNSLVGDLTNANANSLSPFELTDTSMEPLKLKSTLKRTSSISVQDSQSSHFGARKQLKFDLAEDPSDVDTKDTYFPLQVDSSLPILSLQEAQTEPCNEMALDATSFIDPSTGYQSVPIDQWSQTICSEISPSHEHSSWHHERNSHPFHQPPHIHLDSCPLKGSQARLVDFCSPGSSTTHSVTPIFDSSHVNIRQGHRPIGQSKGDVVYASVNTRFHQVNSILDPQDPNCIVHSSSSTHFHPPHHG